MVDIPEAYKIFEPLGIGFCILNNSLGVISANESLKKILEIENFNEHTAFPEIIPFSKQEQKQLLYDRLSSGISIIDFHLNLQMTSGALKFAELNISKAENQLFILLKDITLFKLEEKRIKTENFRFHSFLDHVQGMVYFKDKDSKFILVNNAKAEEHQLTKNDLIGKSDFDFYLPEEAKIKFEDEQAIIANKLEVNKDEIIYTQRGKRWIFTSKAPLYDVDGNIEGTYGISWDITARVLYERASRAIEAANRAIVAALPDTLFHISNNGEIINCNFIESETEIFNKIREAKNIFKVISNGLHAKFKNAIETCITKGEYKFEFDLEENATPIFFEARFSTINEQEVIVIFRNITQSKKYEVNLKMAMEKAEEANRIKSQFLANVSHELRTPMNGIIGISSMLLRYKNQNLTEKQIEGLKGIQISGNRLLDLINDLLDLSNIEAGKMTVNLESFSLEQLFYNLRIIVTNLAKDKAIQFIIRKCDKIPDRIILDEKKINQILLNLIGNAIKFTEKGKVILRVHNIEDKLYFEVIDEGIGISEEHLSIVFDEFKQIDNTNTRRYQGTGLGLTICKKLVHLLQGKIEIESKLNEGTIVRFYIPYKTETEFPASKNTLQGFRENNARHKDTKKILIIEDEKLTLHLLKDYLGDMDYQVLTAENGKEGYMSILSNNPDLLILDLGLPELSGIDILDMLRSDERYMNLPVVICSINDTEMPLGYINEYTCFLRKPVNDNVLNYHINKLLRLKSPLRYKVLILDECKELGKLEKSLNQSDIPSLFVYDSSFFLYEIEYNAPMVIILHKTAMDNVNIIDINRYLRKGHIQEIRDCYLIIYTDRDYYKTISTQVSGKKVLFYDKANNFDEYSMIQEIGKLINSHPQ